MIAMKRIVVEAKKMSSNAYIHREETVERMRDLVRIECVDYVLRGAWNCLTE